MYTQDDLKKVKQAIIKLAAGERVVQINFTDGRSASYQQASLSDLQALASQIASDLLAQKTGRSKRGYRLRHSSGIRS